MPRELTPITLAHKNQLESESPFVWLYEFQDSSATPQRWRLTNYTERVFYRGNTFYPAPVVHGGVETKTGATPKIDISVGAQSNEIVPLIELGDGFIGNPARITVVSILDIEDANAGLLIDGEIESVALDENQFTVSVSGHNAFLIDFPSEVYSKRKCRFTFGDNRCGYDIASGNYDKCGTTKAGDVNAAPYTLAACRLIGQDEQTVHSSSSHPARFGGFPGIRPARQ